MTWVRFPDGEFFIVDFNNWADTVIPRFEEFRLLGRDYKLLFALLYNYFVRVALPYIT